MPKVFYPDWVAGLQKLWANLSIGGILDEFGIQAFQVCPSPFFNTVLEIKINSFECKVKHAFNSCLHTYDAISVNLAC